MKRTRKLAFGSALVACTLALSACASAGTTQTGERSSVPSSVDLKGETVVSLYTSFNNDYYSSWDTGAQRAVKAFNGKYVALTNEGDPATQLAQFQQQVDAGVKIFFVTAPDPANVPAMAKIATENEVCFANTWEQPPWSSPFDSGDGYSAYLTSNSVAAGYEVAKALFDEMGGQGNFVHLTGHPGSTPDSQRTIGVDKALAEYPKVKMIARQPGEWNRDDARNAMAGIISKYGDDIQGVFGQNDDVGIGAVNALKEAGIEGVPVTGVDGNAGTMELIKAGDIFGSYTTFPQWGAGFSLVQALDACRGGDIQPLNRQLWTQGLFVTADNVDEYLSTYAGDNDPYDWVKMSKVAHPDDWDPQNGVTAINMDDMWAHADKPANYVAPKEYADNVANIQQINDEWAAHWKTVK